MAKKPQMAMGMEMIPSIKKSQRHLLNPVSVFQGKADDISPIAHPESPPVPFIPLYRAVWR